MFSLEEQIKNQIEVAEELGNPEDFVASMEIVLEELKHYFYHNDELDHEIAKLVFSHMEVLPADVSSLYFIELLGIGGFKKHLVKGMQSPRLTELIKKIYIKGIV